MLIHASVRKVEVTRKLVNFIQKYFTNLNSPVSINSLVLDLLLKLTVN